MRPRGRTSWPTGSIRMQSSVVAMLFVSHDEALRGGSGRVMALTIFSKTGEREKLLGIWDGIYRRGDADQHIGSIRTKYYMARDQGL